MTLLFIDGFDHYPLGDMVDKWGFAGTSSCNIGSAYARFGIGQGFRNYGYSSYVAKVLPTDLTTVYMGLAIYKESSSNLGGGSTEQILFEDSNGVDQIKICPQIDLSYDVYRGDNTLLGGSSAGVFSNYKWYFLEVKVTISDTVGEVIVRINGSNIINLTSQDTRYGLSTIHKIFIRGFSPNQYGWWDDVYIDDAQFHGDCRIRTFMPDSDGNSSDFTRSTGSNDYECVDESISNGDTDYISSDTLNHKSIFGITTGSLGTVKGIQLNNHCRLDQAGTRKITPIIRSNSTDYSGTETEAIAANYQFENEIWETDPDDSNVWTQTKLEAAEFGLQITT